MERINKDMNISRRNLFAPLFGISLAAIIGIPHKLSALAVPSKIREIAYIEADAITGEEINRHFYYFFESNNKTYWVYTNKKIETEYRKAHGYTSLDLIKHYIFKTTGKVAQIEERSKNDVALINNKEREVKIEVIKDTFNPEHVEFRMESCKTLDVRYGAMFV